MIPPYADEAIEMRLGFQAGVIDSAEIIAWADSRILEYDYDDDLASVSLASKVPASEMVSLLSRVSHAGDEWPAMRRVLARMYDAIVEDRSLAHGLTTFLERFWVRHNYEVPEDMSFIIAVEDEFLLAMDGVYGDVESSTDSLIDELAKYKK